MALILFSFVYLFGFSAVYGVGFARLFSIRQGKPVETLFLGFFCIALLTSSWAFFGRIHWEFQAVLLSGSILIGFYLSKNLKQLLKKFSSEFRDWTLFFKIIFTVSFIMVLMQCASAPFLLDNESYYIQTIKWLNEFGFVKGLANLHLFFGQSSGWHILQSGVNLNFLYSNFNDLSGFCLLLAYFWSFAKLNRYFKNPKNNFDLILSLFPLASLFFFQFISSPSPDIPVFALTFIGIGLVAESFKEANTSAFKLLCCLMIFSVFIKTTSIALCFFPLVVLLKHFKSLKVTLPKLIGLGVLTLLIFVSKNLIISGYPLFPTPNLDVFSADWKLPEVMAYTYYDLTKAFGFYMQPNDYYQFNLWELFKIWLQTPKLYGLFNVAALAFLLTFPFAILKSKEKGLLLLIYAVFAIQMVLLFLTSPQYRFFFNLLFILVCIVLSKLVFQKKLIVKLGLCFTLSVPLFLLVSQLGNRSFSIFSSISFSSSMNSFSIDNVVFPHDNSKFETTFDIERKGNLDYNSPKAIDFFWGTGNGDLPSVRKEQIDYLETWLGYYPQLRNPDKLSEGFYSEPSNPEKE